MYIRGVGRVQTLKELEMKVGKVGNSLRVTLPKTITDMLEIQTGDMLGVQIIENKIIMRKLNIADKHNSNPIYPKYNRK